MKRMICFALTLALCLTAVATFAAGEDIKIYVDGVLIQPTDANGNPVTPVIIDGTTYLPVRAVGNAIGRTVTWDQATQSVYLGIVPGTTPSTEPTTEPSTEPTTEPEMDMTVFSQLATGGYTENPYAIFGVETITATLKTMLGDQYDTFIACMASAYADKDSNAETLTIHGVSGQEYGKKEAILAVNSDRSISVAFLEEKCAALGDAAAICYYSNTNGDAITSSVVFDWVRSMMMTHGFQYLYFGNGTTPAADITGTYENLVSGKATGKFEIKFDAAKSILTYSGSNTVNGYVTSSEGEASVSGGCRAYIYEKGKPSMSITFSGKCLTVIGLTDDVVNSKGEFTEYGTKDLCGTYQLK